MDEWLNNDTYFLPFNFSAADPASHFAEDSGSKDEDDDLEEDQHAAASPAPCPCHQKFFLIDLQTWTESDFLCHNPE